MVDIGSLTLGMNVATIAGAIGLALLIWSFSQGKQKRDTKRTLNIIGGIGIAVFLLPVFGFMVETLGAPFQTGAGVTSVVTTTVSRPLTTVGCAVEDTTVTLSGKDKYTAVSTGGTHRYRLNGAPALTVADAGTFTASPGDTIEVLFGNETDGTYFGAVKKETIPCKGTVTISAESVQNTTFTLDIFDDDGAGKLDGTARNVTLGSGDTVSLDVDIYSANKKGFSHGGVLIVDVNKSNFDEEEIYLDFPTLGGRLKKVSNPSVESLDSLDSVIVTFEVPSLEGATKHRGTLYLQADSTNNPADNGDPTIVFMPYDYFINEDTGGSFDGPAVEDEDRVQTFGHRTSTTLHLS